VNKADNVNQAAGELEAEAVRTLKEVPGLDVVRQPGRGRPGPDFLVTFGETRLPVAVEVRTHANAATAWQLLHYAEEFRDLPLLVIARDSTDEARRILADHGVGLVDGLGNAHLALPGLLIHLEPRRGPRKVPTDTPPVRLRGRAGLAAEALLLEPNRSWHVQDLRRVAGVSTGLAHRVLTRLEGEGLLEAEGSGPSRVRRVRNPAALLDLWAEENVAREESTGVYVLGRSPHELIRGVGKNLGAKGVVHAVTGAAAASLVAPFATAVPVVDVWVSERVVPTELCEYLEGELVPDGQNVVLHQERGDVSLRFREKRDELWITSRFRIYLDLRRDPRRGRTQADNLREEVIGF
jgi:hypothetical protein